MDDRESEGQREVKVLEEEARAHDHERAAPCIIQLRVRSLSGVSGEEPSSPISSSNSHVLTLKLSPSATFQVPAASPDKPRLAEGRKGFVSLSSVNVTCYSCG